MAVLKVKIGDIGREGYTFKEKAEADFAELTEQDHLQFISPFDITAKFDRYDNDIVVAVTVKSRYVSFCYRSLERVERDFTCSFILDYELEGAMQYIDITEDVRQEIILALPMRVLSDKELEKEKKNTRAAFTDSDEAVGGEEPRTYRPFEGLKDIE